MSERQDYMAAAYPAIGNIFANAATALAGNNPGLLAAGQTAQKFDEQAYQGALMKAAYEKMKREQSKGLGGKIGQGLGMAASLAAAPFTGGASLMAMPAFMGAGQSVGGMFDSGSPNVPYMNDWKNIFGAFAPAGKTLPYAPTYDPSQGFDPFAIPSGGGYGGMTPWD